MVSSICNSFPTVLKSSITGVLGSKGTLVRAIRAAISSFVSGAAKPSCNLAPKERSFKYVAVGSSLLDGGGVGAVGKAVVGFVDFLSTGPVLLAVDCRPLTGTGVPVRLELGLPGADFVALSCIGLRRLASKFLGTDAERSGVSLPPKSGPVE